MIYYNDLSTSHLTELLVGETEKLLELLDNGVFSGDEFEKCKSEIEKLHSIISERKQNSHTGTHG